MKLRFEFLELGWQLKLIAAFLASFAAAGLKSPRLLRQLLPAG